MYQFILVIHTLIAVCIIALVLVQQGKGTSIGPAYGGGASQTVFGSRGSGSFLYRLTMTFIAAFFLTSISLNYLTTSAYKQQAAINLPVSSNGVPADKTSTPSPLNEIPVRH
jgi:preprotein translocase subunit SecG